MPMWMIVEDEPALYELLLAMFEIWGIDGIAFVDGESAVAWIDDVDSGRYLGEMPELALLDIRLPGTIDGLSVGARLRHSPTLGTLPIVLSTAYQLTPEQEAHALRQAGADRLICKPFHQLQKQLEETLENCRSMAVLKNGIYQAGTSLDDR